MKAKKILMIAACFAALLTSCGTRDDTEPDSPLAPSGTAAGNGQLAPSGTPTPDAGGLLSMDEATAVACQDAGVLKDGLESLHARLSEGDAGKEYTVAFTTPEKSYQYRIAASDGMILEKTVDTIDQNSDIKLSSSQETLPGAPQEDLTTTQPTTTPGVTAPPAATSTPVPTPTPAPTSTPKPTQAAPDKTGNITQDEAVEIARKDAGVSQNDLCNLKVKLDYEDGVQVYDIEFDAGSREYEYEVAVLGGKILKRESEPLDSIPSSAQPGTAQDGGITQEEAVAIALRDADVSASEALRLTVKLDEEDGISVYEIDFDTLDKEYDYEISASDGKILKRDMELADDAPAGTSATSGTTTADGIITQDAALELAKADAGISGAEIFDLEAKLDYDDGIWQYEIGFCCGDYEYEYDICASDGRILKKDCDDCYDHWHSSSHHN